MRIQGLAVIALLIIVPMTIILSSYSKSQIQTLQNQISYDTKLNNSTYDAIKAYQLNMTNSTTSDFANSKMRDIKAAINVFYSSLASNFNMTGYGEEVLKDYVPAVVYTSYDGYYIYSAYKNKTTPGLEVEKNTTYDKETLYGFKPYIYYSCRYNKNGIDVVITYSLDSYITIQGTYGDKTINESGYLLSGVRGVEDGEIEYNGIVIPKDGESGDSLKGQVYDDDKNIKEFRDYPQAKLNGVKYYYNDGNKQVFSMVNDNKHIQGYFKGDGTDDPEVVKLKERIEKNTGGYDYYNDALKFKNKITSLTRRIIFFNEH